MEQTGWRFNCGCWGSKSTVPSMPFRKRWGSWKRLSVLGWNQKAAQLQPFIANLNKCVTLVISSSVSCSVSMNASEMFTVCVHSSVLVSYLPTFPGKNVIYVSAENPLRRPTDTQRKATRWGYRIALVALFLNHHGKEETGKVELLLKVWHC